MIKNAKYIKVDARVRYWDDAEINGNRDESGADVPFKNGDLWQPVINILDGSVEDWPIGKVARFHFKVCDAGNYHLLDEDKKVIAERFDNYVPDGLCHGDSGYGDYIIFNVDENGKIIKYKKSIDADDWFPEED